VVFWRATSLCRDGSDGRDRSIGRLFLFGSDAFNFTFARAFWPDVEAAMIQRADVPRTPYALAFAEATIENTVRAGVGFGPRTFQRLRAVIAANLEPAHVVVAVAAHFASGEREVEVHAVLVLRAVIVKARPRTGGK